MKDATESGFVQFIDSPTNALGGKEYGNVYFAFRANLADGATRFVISAGTNGADRLRDILFFAARNRWALSVNFDESEPVSVDAQTGAKTFLAARLSANMP